MLARRLLNEIGRITTRPWTLMEVCGGQTHSIVRYGLDEVLPAAVELVHGPGCPVCVTPLEMVDRGNQPAATMLNEKKQTESGLTWVLRVAGFFGTFMGVAMFLGPLSAIAGVIPLLGSIVRGAAALAALVVAVPLTLVVVAISWITFRPVLGVGLLVAAAVLMYGLHRWHRAQHPVAPALAASPPVPPPPAA